MANKFFNYMMFSAGTMLLFYFFGLIDGGTVDTLINLLLDPSSLPTSQKIIGLTSLAGGVVLATAAAVTLGFRADIVIFGTIVGTVVFGFIWDFLIVFNTIKDYSPAFAVLLLSPTILMSVFTVLEWWRGVSN